MIGSGNAQPSSLFGASIPVASEPATSSFSVFAAPKQEPAKPAASMFSTAPKPVVASQPSSLFSSAPKAAKPQE